MRRPRLRDVRAILFDFDGTLADTIPLILDSFRYATRTVLGEALPDRTVLENLGRPLAEYLGQLGPDGKADELIRVYREHNLAHHDELIREYPHVRDVVRELHSRGFALAIVTSKGTELACKGLQSLDLAELFDLVVTLEDTQLHKPDPDPVEFAIGALGIAAHRAVYVGDSPWDIVAGRAAGVGTIGVTWGGFSEEEILAAKPDIVIRDARRLLELFPATGASGV